MTTDNAARALGTAGPKRILVLGGGFGGTYTTIHLERRLRRRADVQLTLVSRTNYYLMTPLLFEAASGVLEPRHVVVPIRPLLKRAGFVEAEVVSADLERRVVRAVHPTSGTHYALPYDELVIALGATTNHRLVPGSEQALSFKTLSDAILLRNHVIDLFEQASVEPTEARRRCLLSFVIIGAGLVGIELADELHHFITQLRRVYPNVQAREIRLHVVEASPAILPELDRKLADYAESFYAREGIEILKGRPVERIEPGVVHLRDGERLAGETIVYAAGIAVSPALEHIAVEKDRKGRVLVDATMRSRSHPNVWALGDCAAIPMPDGGTYPALAQHALREAKALARNVAATLSGGAAKPFVYETLGTLALLGRFRAMGKILGVRIHGIFAWWFWRTYYLLQLPRWERQLRVLLDWTLALFFRVDTAELDMKPVQVGFGARGPDMPSVPRAAAVEQPAE